MKRYCSAGKHEVDESEFWKRGSGFQPNCKHCQSNLNKARYKSDSRRHIVNVVQNNAERAKKYQTWKSSIGCQKCDETFFSCLDLHHVDSSNKEEIASKLIMTSSKSKLKHELLKCAILCKNCHAKVHAGILSNVITLTSEQVDLL